MGPLDKPLDLTRMSDANVMQLVKVIGTKIKPGAGQQVGAGVKPTGMFAAIFGASAGQEKVNPYREANLTKLYERSISLLANGEGLDPATRAEMRENLKAINDSIKGNPTFSTAFNEIQSKLESQLTSAEKTEEKQAVSKKNTNIKQQFLEFFEAKNKIDSEIQTPLQISTSSELQRRIIRDLLIQEDRLLGSIKDSKDPAALQAKAQQKMRVEVLVMSYALTFPEKNNLSKRELSLLNALRREHPVVGEHIKGFADSIEDYQKAYNLVGDKMAEIVFQQNLKEVWSMKGEKETTSDSIKQLNSALNGLFKE
ncbi:MAG: hypothetical protein H0W88_04835 [Parachlamydiaceae bacterium]|nr:hypothetical protein [Parachlamydiaceae bacterium]